VRARPFDLIVLDVNLGELDGWAVLNQVLRERPDQRVLMWSGVAQNIDARRRGALGMLAKPFDAGQLREGVADAHGRPLPGRVNSGGSPEPVRAASPSPGDPLPERTPE
jgi:DNA-binding NtrC family response regulator